MGRWEPGARERMAAAALELYAERGFEQTTAADIAERAGVTERTFFRHFADKREVLFDGTSAFERTVLDGIAAAPPDASPLEAAVAGMRAVVPLLEQERGREFAARRAAIIAANTSLYERELLKMATLGLAGAQALRDRGAPEAAARLAAETAVTVFRVAFARWLGDGRGTGLDKCIRNAFADLRKLVAAPAQ